MGDDRAQIGVFCWVANGEQEFVISPAELGALGPLEPLERTFPRKGRHSRAGISR
jgi:hypothetical protein